jgi:hypothetical protein
MKHGRSVGRKTKAPSGGQASAFSDMAEDVSTVENDKDAVFCDTAARKTWSHQVTA